MALFDAAAAIEAFPELKVAFLIGPANPPDGEDAADVPVRIADRIREGHGSAEALAANPLAEGYRQFYVDMGARPSAASTPIKQALRAFERGYRPIHPVVDICMEIEYASLCSFQVYDRERLGSKITYAAASGTEEIAERAHGGGSCKLRRGELALADEHGVINSPMCGNAASRVVTPESRIVVVRILKIPALDDSVFAAAAGEASARLAARHTIVLDREHPIVEVDEGATDALIAQ